MLCYACDQQCMKLFQFSFFQCFLLVFLFVFLCVRAVACVCLYYVWWAGGDDGMERIALFLVI